jgi:hypothetical protein
MIAFSQSLEADQRDQGWSAPTQLVHLAHAALTAAGMSRDGKRALKTACTRSRFTARAEVAAICK